MLVSGAMLDTILVSCVSELFWASWACEGLDIAVSAAHSKSGSPLIRLYVWGSMQPS
eukprot:CAMPEP_0179365502 /NCGR_PEP_ID=MMETSP0797-20121207/82581_1 /TAXON_ID=47934 /ORGANISM="Dinophysis acuminata, Strain DAEP01" /LENGTH=56 /DNA_ID=CAMNT_0021081001 /DNA_START=696 /DNA_END=866 /DNA_ORIENTATION=+